MQRRSFIFGSIATVIAAPRIAAAYVNADKNLCFYHTHTRECLEVAYNPASGIGSSSLKKLNYFLRDYRTEQSKFMDPQLFDMLNDLLRYSNNDDGVFEIISAYRSPKTNSMLRRGSKGVARRSLHLQGKALDIRLRGTPISELRRIAMNMRCGGVGYYPRSNFLHIDTGNVRHW